MEKAGDNIQTRLQQLLDILHLKNADVARATGLGSSNITQMLRGKRPITARTIKKVCEAYGVNYDWLAEGKGSINVGASSSPVVMDDGVATADSLSEYGSASSSAIIAKLVDGITSSQKILEAQLNEHNRQLDRLLTIIENLQTK